MTDFRTTWGDEAHHHWKNIKGKGARKKQCTLTLLVDAIAGGGSITRTLAHHRHDDSIGSKQSHYHWLTEDEAYANWYRRMLKPLHEFDDMPVAEFNINHLRQLRINLFEKNKNGGSRDRQLMRAIVFTQFGTTFGLGKYFANGCVKKK